MRVGEGIEAFKAIMLGLAMEFPFLGEKTKNGWLLQKGVNYGVGVFV